MTIVFPDGSNDTAVLQAYNPIPPGPGERPEDIEACIFLGTLTNESSVVVSLTGACSEGKDLQSNFEV